VIPVQLTPAILSGILPGAGQIYNREFTKGLDLILLQALFIFLVFLSDSAILAVIGTVMIPVVWVYAVVDAGHVYSLPLSSTGSTYTFKKITTYVICLGIVPL
jgi:TM2 domain-containing membrane protein YozV